MATIQCKICGGMMELTGGRTLGDCPFCGSQVTLPRVTDETHAAAFDRGNHFRRIGEFDKALAVYERIAEEDEGNAEAHWCCALCRFGIEYVKDPATGAYMPTCHRASFDSFLEDVDTLAAIQHADPAARARYEQDAEKIAEVQRGILAVSQREAPFDVFLCYKETGADGQRTHDSALAQDVYYQLADQNLRVFFARITLEDKPGTAYEPYIFAALNTAKVMVVIGTKPEHLGAPWVKNEWSRFLALMKRDRSRLLIPCYRDMDPYDMPEQLSILQGYDMSRIGFIQDLVRGIRKVVGEDKSAGQQAAPAPTAAPATPATEPLLRRVALFLEDGDWKSADEYCERVLDIDPENARAYVGKLMAALRVSRQEKLREQAEPFDQNPNYAKALRFADDALAGELRGMVAHICERNENARKEAAYRKAEKALAAAETEEAFVGARKQFEVLGGWHDAAARAQKCETARLDWLYQQAERVLAAAKTEEEFKSAQRMFMKLGDWRDAAQKADECETARKDWLYRQAEDALKGAKAEQDFINAQRMFMKLGDWRDAAQKADECETARKDWLYRQAEDALKGAKAEQDFINAQRMFEKLGGYRDAAQRAQECDTARKDWLYQQAEQTLTMAKVAQDSYGSRSPARYFYDARKLFETLGDWRDAKNRAAKCETARLDFLYQRAERVVAQARTEQDFERAKTLFEDLSDWRDAPQQAELCRQRIRDLEAAEQVRREARIAFMRASRRHIIAAGETHTVGLLTEGASNPSSKKGWFSKLFSSPRPHSPVVAAGSNKFGQCDVDTSSWMDVVAIAAGDYHTVGLRADGTVVAVGSNKYGQCDVSGWKDIVAIATSNAHTVGLRADGTVIAAGSDKFGECKLSEWKDIVAISAGYSHTVGLRADGTVVAVGNNNQEQCNVSSWKNIVAIAAADARTVALRADGTVVAVGVNDSGQCDVGSWNDIVAIAASYWVTVGLRANGTVVAVGSNNHRHHVEGSIINCFGKCEVAEWLDIVAIAAGHSTTVGLRADGTVVATGRNDHSQCNLSFWRLRTVPRPTLPK